MRIFAIRDETDVRRKDLAYLFYYEMEKCFYIELPDDADPWETPLILSSVLEKGEKTVSAYWSKTWVRQRIVPLDRQNIGQILRDNGLCEYDEFQLLMLSMGRCAQDDYFLEEIREADLPQTVKDRFERRLEDVVPLQKRRLLIFLRNGQVKCCDLREYFQERQLFRILLEKEEYFNTVDLQTGGYGVTWDRNLNIADFELDRIGEEVPLTGDDFQSFVTCRVINAAQAAELLDCSRQNISDLVKRGRLHPLKASGKSTLFLKSEVVKRSWQ